jgi:hypothetical protein
VINARVAEFGFTATRSIKSSPAAELGDTTAPRIPAYEGHGK